jgi:haloalkane dehalogenase
MNRRDVFAMSLGLLVAGGVAATALGRQPSGTSATDDDAATIRFRKERRFMQTEFGRIAYIERGSGPAVLFMHGFPLSKFQWRGAIERLSGERRCLAPDSMGLGETEVAPGQSVTPSAQADMMLTLLDRLNVDKVDIVANDSGGAVAQLFVTRHPHRVKSLLLTNCDAENDSPPRALTPILEAARSGIYPDLYLEPWLNHGDVARSPTGLGGLCYSNPNNPTDAALGQYLGPLVSSPARKALVNRYTLGLTPNPLQGIEAKLRKCPVPVRVVWGMSDPIFSPQTPDYFASVFPKFTGIRKIPDARLFFPEEYPDIVVAEARALWRQAARA